MRNPLSDHDYMRTIGLFGVAFYEQYARDVTDTKVIHTFTLMKAEGDEDEIGEVVGTFVWELLTGTGQSVDVMNTMPEGWHWPVLSVVDELIAAYDARGTVLPALPDVVTFVTPMENGSAQLQRRAFRGRNGARILDPGKDSINGGGMKTANVMAELIREGMEELRVPLTEDDFDKVGDLYDPSAGRCNHVFRVNKGYDTLLKTRLTVEEAVDALTRPEGIGRNFLWLEDLQDLRSEGLLTSISELIFTKFPELLPLPRPQA